ncbi:ACP S-malonyltransferase [Rhizobacter sp. LjRoot28]|uniref:ACP S-malonyltransferase n=1 Tax=Rhizobacter sp. LjRoot28 TaxID=3342309 RepID=UPI003ED0BB4C
MSYAVLFSGQGAQHPAMLPWLDTDPLIDRVQALLGIGDWRHALEDAAWAVRNRNAQLLLTGVGLAAWGALAARLPAPAAIAGYSVGELAAFSAAGAFSPQTALDLASVRAEAMDRCAAASPGSLMAVSGISEAELLRLCEGTGLAVAIRLDRDSLVLGGPSAALSAIEPQATAMGARCTPLAVSVPSHTPSMQPAADDFLATLERLELNAPRITLIGNATGDRLPDGQSARAALADQMATTVRWSDVLDTLHARRVSCVLEVGPGRALAAGWNRIHPDVPARSVEDFRSVEAVTAWVRSQA